MCKHVYQKNAQNVFSNTVPEVENNLTLEVIKAVINDNMDK